MIAIDQSLFHSIQLSELQGLQWLRYALLKLSPDFCLLMLISDTRKMHAPAIAAIATRARAIALWTASLVLSAPSEQRTEALTWVLQLLRASFELHNHACCVAMLAGLQLPCVAGLRPLWAAVADTSAVASHALITTIFLPDHDWLCAYHQKLSLRTPCVTFRLTRRET